jgi:hypothetical protein
LSSNCLTDPDMFADAEMKWIAAMWVGLKAESEKVVGEDTSLECTIPAAR